MSRRFNKTYNYKNYFKPNVGSCRFLTFDNEIPMTYLPELYRSFQMTLRDFGPVSFKFSEVEKRKLVF